MAWVILVLAGFFEIGWAVGLKYTEGFSRFWPSLATVLSMAISLALLGAALRTLPLGTAYAVWTGIGAVGTVLLGIALFGEPPSAARLICAGFIVAGIVGLKLTAPHLPLRDCSVGPSNTDARVLPTLPFHDSDRNRDHPKQRRPLSPSRKDGKPDQGSIDRGMEHKSD
jgi:quaternary ammonium compound-resistance protein SugE